MDLRGALLAASGMLLLVFALVKAPTVGWGSARTLAELGGAFALLAAFLLNERRHRNPIAPLSIFRINGLGSPTPRSSLRSPDSSRCSSS